MQIDIGFGDVVYPEPVESELPTMLDSPAPRLLCYSRESTIAEKLEAMVKRGVLNSRMKDFYDICRRSPLLRQTKSNRVDRARSMVLSLWISICQKQRPAFLRPEKLIIASF